MPSKAKEQKIFVLDTSVIIFEHISIMNFDEHDVAIPITVLEELDNFKKGNDTKNFEAREFTRLLDKLAKDQMLQKWNPLNGSKKGKFKVLMSGASQIDATKVFDEGKADHRILNSALKLQEEEKSKKVILVTKDINLRLKAKSLGLHADDYNTGKVKNVNSLYTGKATLDKVSPDKINELYDKGKSPISDILGDFKPDNNGYYILKSGKKSILSYFNPVTRDLEHVEKRSAHGIKPRNAEQAFAINAILNPNIKLVSMQGVAGTGKNTYCSCGSLRAKKRVQTNISGPPYRSFEQ